jgi:hypothetical protein
VERIFRNEAGIKVYHSSKNKLFRALCTHKDNVNESHKPGVYRIPCECGLVYIGETGRNLSVRLKERLHILNHHRQTVCPFEFGFLCYRILQDQSKLLWLMCLVVST